MKRFTIGVDNCTKDGTVTLCTSLIKQIEHRTDQTLFLDIYSRLLYLQRRLITDNNYTHKLVERAFLLCTVLEDILTSDKIKIDDINKIKQSFDELFIFYQLPLLNSSDFYTKEISKLESQIENYKKKLDEHGEETENETVLKEKITELESSIETLKTEKETVEKQNEAISNWKTKITEAFQGLKGPIGKLQQEHNRLKILYKIYGITSIVLVLLLITIEIVVCYKINNTVLYPTWEQYWTMILPVPITIGLLWGFITQMNRSQRQMVVLARQIYEVEYIEGLLQALNTLSVDIGESMSKINEAISHLIDNHLRNMDGMHIDETTLQKLEKQDALPYEKIPELIKLLNAK